MLKIDIETYSKTDLKKAGVYRYSEDPAFKVLLFGVSVDNSPVKVYDLARGEKLPISILEGLLDTDTEKWAHNAQFERVCLSRYLWDLGLLPRGQYLNPKGWYCSMIWSVYLGFPASLRDVGVALKLDEQKIVEGKELIKFFCTGKQNFPTDAPEKWEAFVKYNARDVEVEMAIMERLSAHPVPEHVWKEYWLDQEINDRGIAIDLPMVQQAIALDSEARQRLVDALQELTGLDNPRSVQQMQNWLKSQGMEMDSLGKKFVAEALKDAPEPLRTVLELRQQLAMSSVRKYEAMQNAVCQDGRLRGMFKFYGASKTGRFSGAIVQLQNLYRNTLPDLDLARELVKLGDYAAIDTLYGSVPEVLAECVRTAFIPAKGYKFIVADFSAIEARVLAWLAGEQWVLDVFQAGGDIYCETASRMFHVPVEKHGQNAELRQKGKQAVLSCIAEGQLVLTDKGLIPIEDVTVDMKIWDGKEWVKHDGVIYRGKREVISYEGLTATPDHLVYIEGQEKPIRFDYAAASGAHLIQTGDGRRAIRLGKNNQSRKTMEQNMESLLCFNTMPRVRFNPMARTVQLNIRKVEGLPKLYTAKSHSTMARTKTYSGQASMRKSKRLALWCKRDKVRISKRNRSWTLPDSKIRSARQNIRNRPYRQQWKLCTWQYSLRYKERELCKQANNRVEPIRPEILAVFRSSRKKKTFGRFKQRRDYSRGKISSIEKTKKLAVNQEKTKVYDILNAGRHHCFTVSGKLIHNCGYGGSVEALRRMGAIEAGMKEEELQPLVNAWRTANPKIVRLWWDVDKAVKDAIRGKTSQTHGLVFEYRGAILYITLPSKRQLTYVKPRIVKNRFGGESVSYIGVNTARQWTEVESYGPKFVENCVQAISRDLLCHSMEQLRNYRICAHVHDEIIIECNTQVETVCTVMALPPEWAKGLPLKADGYETKFYKKD